MSVDQNQIRNVSLNVNMYRSDSEGIIEDLSSRQATISNNKFPLKLQQSVDLRDQDQPISQKQIEINKKVLQNLPEANELLPKKREPVEQAKLVLKIPLMNLPSFSGQAPQREELHRSKSEECLQQYSTNKGRQNQFNKSSSKKKQSNKLQQQQSFQLSGSNNQTNFQDGTLLKQQEKQKGLANMRVKHMSLHQGSCDSEVDSNDVSRQAIDKRGYTNDQKSSKKKISSTIINSGNKHRDNETNLQRYFLRLNIVYKKYSEIHYPCHTPPAKKNQTEENDTQQTEEDGDVSTKNQNKLKKKPSKDGLFLSNVVQFNTIYCDLRRLIKSQNETKNINNSYINSTNQSALNDKQVKGQSPLNGTNPVKKIGMSDNTNLQDKKNEGNNIMQELEPYYKKRSQGDKTLIFESRFESGNLSQAAKISENEYDLLLQNDINTHGHTQWFFFKVKNTDMGTRVKFNILNFCKSDSLFNQGMKVLVYSKNQAISQNKGWYRSCESISYYKNNFIRKQMTVPQAAASFSETKNMSFQNKAMKAKNYFSLSFTYQFESADDEVYFAYNYPYTYSELQEYLDNLENTKSDILNRRLLCRTLAGNRIDLLTITSRNDLYDKQGIILSARVHSGETVSSFVMKGIIDNLLSDTEEAQQLRERFIFKIVPMLNPDGVVHGNYRCSLSGCDLNRRWKTPLKTLHPEIFHFKQMIYNFASSTKLSLFCDLHGHSMKKNIFIYGCHDKQQPLACRELPFLMSKLYEPFSFNDCNFLVQKSKEGTARVALWEGLRIPNIFTLESSFCGPSYDNIHFQQSDLEKMGARMCQAFLIYFSAEKKKTGENESLEDSQLRNSRNLKSIQGRVSSNSPYSPACKTEQLYRGTKNKFNSIQNEQNSDSHSQKNTVQNGKTPIKQLRSISLDDSSNNKHQTQLEDLKKHYLNELWTKSLSEIQKIGMDESDDSDSCPSEDNLDEREIHKIFDKTVQSQQKLINSRKNNLMNNTRSQKKQSFLNSSLLNNSQSQSPSPTHAQNNQQLQNDENSPVKKKESGWNSYFCRGPNSVSAAKKLSNSEEKLLATQKLNRQSELNDSINQTSQKKNIQSSQVTLAAIKNKAFNFQCVSPVIPTNKHSPENRYDDLGSASPKKLLYYQQINARQLPSLQKMTQSMIDNENIIEKKRQKYLKQQKGEEQQPFIANTLSKQIKYLQPNQQVQQQQQLQQHLNSKQKINNSQFTELLPIDQQKNIQDKNKILRPQYQQGQYSTPLPPQPQQLTQQQPQIIQQAQQTNAFTNARQSPYKRKYHKNVNGTIYKQNNKSLQFDQSFVGQNLSQVLQLDKNTVNNQHRNNLSNIEFRDEGEDLSTSILQGNQKMMLNQSMLPSLYTYESSDTKQQITEMQQDFLNVDLYDSNSYQRVNHFSQIPSASPKNTTNAFNNQLKNTQSNNMSAVQTQIKKKLQKDNTIYIHQEKAQNPSHQLQNQSVEESAASTMRNDLGKTNNNLYNALYSNQNSQNPIPKQSNLYYHDYIKYKNNGTNKINSSANPNSVTINQTFSQQSYYDHSQKFNEKQTLCSSSQDYHGKNESLINLTNDQPLKIRLNKNNFNTINQINSSINQQQSISAAQAEPQSQSTLDDVLLNNANYNNTIINQRVNYSLGPPTIPENQFYPKIKGKKKAFEQLIKRDIQQQIFNQKTSSINSTIIDQFNQSLHQEFLGENALMTSLLGTGGLEQGSQTTSKVFQANLSKKYDFQLQNNSLTNIPENYQQQYHLIKDKNDSIQIKNSIVVNLNNPNSNAQTLVPSKSIRSTSCAKQKKTVNLQNNPLSKDQNPISMRKIIFSSVNEVPLKQVI